MTELATQRIIHILLVEDNEADVILTKEAFSQSKVQNKIYVAKNADEAFALLHGSDTSPAISTIDLILLDINLPGRNGFEILKTIRGIETTRDIPIIMLSGSASDTDIQKSYDLQASSYITKPNSTEEFNEIVQAVEMCWFKGITRLHQAKKQAEKHFTVRSLSTMVRTS